MDRRGLLSVLAVALAAPKLARAQDVKFAPLPEGLDAQKCPGLSWFGSGPAAIEIFDYNCPNCRAVFQALDARASKPGALRLGLIDSPQLSVGSIQAAKLGGRRCVFMDRPRPTPSIAGFSPIAAPSMAKPASTR